MTSRRKASDPRRRAHEMLREFNVTAAPVNVREIAEGRGLIVRLVPLEDDLSGMIFFRDDVPVIVVNSLHHPTRQRFSLGHELGHFELHLPEIGKGVHVDKKYFVMARDGKSSQGIDQREIAANRFAAELLVPSHFLAAELRGRILDVEDETLVGELARTFDVSKQMMAIRIGQLAGA